MDTQQPATLAESRKAPIVVGSGDLLGISDNKTNEMKMKKRKTKQSVSHIKSILKIRAFLMDHPRKPKRSVVKLAGRPVWKCNKCGGKPFKPHREKIIGHGCVCGGEYERMAAMPNV